MKIGFIGLGIMGRPMAGHLLEGGHDLYLHDLRPVPQNLVEKGGHACRSNTEAAAQGDVIITMVPDTPDVEAAIFGADGVAQGLAPGKTVVDMSSISPIATKDFARRWPRRATPRLRRLTQRSRHPALMPLPLMSPSPMSPSPMSPPRSFPARTRGRPTRPCLSPGLLLAALPGSRCTTRPGRSSASA
jgi:hypothetical protein